ncbi:hypothetical protein KLEPA_00269 (plasmid) [Klebsiella pneumoniae]
MTEVPNVPLPSSSGYDCLEAGGPRIGTLPLSSCSLFARHLATSAQDLSYRQRTERNRLAKLIRVQPSVKTEVLLNASP